ncbi:hypothetical protein BDK51DRAFT_33384, partial [Blyttiomyces helicus]
MQIIHSLAVVVLATAAIATPLPQNDPTIVGKGQHCGGFIDSAPQCEFGLVCKLGRVPDAGGICTERIAEEGQHCGGFILNPPVCDSGLTCSFIGRNPDGVGICRKTPQLETRSVAAPIALKGEHCGGFKENAPKCQFGLVCKLGLIPDAGGVCTERLSEEGQHCGGFILNPPVCDSGLTCHLGPVPDGGGICRKAPQVETRGVAASTKAPIALKGEQCGGFKLNAPKCQFGLVCKLGLIPDAGGVCTERV